MLPAKASMSWLFLINDFIAERKLGQRQVCVFRTGKTFRHLLTALAQHVPRQGHGVSTESGPESHSGLPEGKDDQCTTEVKPLHEREGTTRGGE